MNGTIDFPSLAELSSFLKEFCGSTALFRVVKVDNFCWRLEFTGGF
jgi:hypothetical protein